MPLNRISVLFFLCACILGCANDKVSEEKIVESGPGSELAVDNEAEERKKRSIELLVAEGIPCLKTLPVLPSASQSIRRTTDEVARRAMALFMVAVKGEGIEQDILVETIGEYELENYFTPKEKEFIFNLEPSQVERTQFAWRYECFAVMLWALGFEEEIASPDRICDASKVVRQLVDRGLVKFLSQAKLREQDELLDAADLVYRQHWACVSARVKGKGDPKGLHSGILYERHYALNWLIGYREQDWDDISTDT